MKRHLYACPGRPPRWWPRTAAGKPAWVGVLKGGCGWCVGQGDSMTTAEIKMAMDLLDLRGKTFRVRT